MPVHDLEIFVSGFCNLLNFEQLLAAHMKDSDIRQGIKFDLSQLEWIGSLQVSMLYEWVRMLLTKGKNITIDLGSSCQPNQAVTFLTRINFFDELKKAGVHLSGKLPIVKSLGLAAFKNFRALEELVSYEKALIDINSLNSLLGGGADIDVIRDGDLREILLHELGQNAFVHGEGKSVRYVVSEFSSSESRREHSILSSFAGKSYIEVVVSDAGPGLINTLRNVVPENYTPDAIPKAKKLNKNTRIMAYAFEFSSTSDEEGRKARIADILKDGHEIAQVIPTGLFYVASLAKLYTAQILVRTANSMISLDYSTSPRPIIDSKSKLTTVSGTHILVRIPRERHEVQPAKWAKISLTTTSHSLLKTIFISLGEICNKCDSEATFLVRTEKEMVRAFALAEKNDVPGVAILCDGLQVETKTFAAMLIMLAVIPRRSRFLIMLGLRRELLENALAQWQKIQEMRKDRTLILERIRGYRSFILASDDFSKAIEFGDMFYEDSTILPDPSKSKNHLEFSQTSLISIYREAIKKELRKIIQSPAVKHPIRYYLIENKYYTCTFYEIGKIVASELASSLALNYFRLISQQYKIGAIFTVPEPLYKFSERLGNSVSGLKTYNRDPTTERTSFMEALLGKQNGTKLLILTDVICTATEVQKFIAPSPDEVLVGCFVDGREDKIPYLIVKQEDKAYSVPVLTLHKDPISPIFDLPGHVDPSKILIIDPKTHAPTSYDHIETPEILPHQLLERAIENKALYCGHLRFHGKHYSTFLYFSQLFQGLRSELHAWWDATFDNLRRRKIKPENVTVLYLDEQRGWERLVPEYMSTKGVKRCEALTKEQLYAPPEPNEREEVIWFILPAMASGDTAMLCLEYGSRFRAKEINILIIVARIDSTRLSFYQNVTGYRDCSVKIRTLSCLPIMAYFSGGSCPLCAADKVIEEIRHKISGYEYISGGIARAKDLVGLQDIVLDELGTSHPQIATERDQKRALMRVLYEEALRSIEHRKELGALLDLEGAEIFFEMIGNEFLSDRFSEDNVRRATYTRYEFLKTEALRCIEAEHTSGLSMRALLGLHGLFPEILSQNMKALFLYALKSGNRQLCEDLVLLALTDPERYGIGVAGITHFDYRLDWQKNLMGDIRIFPHWHETESSYAVQDFSTLLWLLRRSSPWGTNLETLRAVVQTPGSSKEDIKRALALFESDGVRAVLHHVAQLKNREIRKPGGLWSALISGGDAISPAAKIIEEKIDFIKGLLEDNDMNRDKLLLALNELDGHGKEITRQLEKLFTNPIDAKMKTIELSAERWPNARINIRFTIADDQPGILISVEDLVHSICHVIDNANDCVLEHIEETGAQGEAFWIEFAFLGYTPERAGAEMIIKDNLPWKEEIVPRGGMKQFVEYCKKYAALYDFSPQTSDETQKIRVIYKIDDKRVRHVY